MEQSSRRARAKRTLLLSLTWLAGCDDARGLPKEHDADAGSNPPILEHATELAAGDLRCPLGGQLIERGPDEDHDGVLDAEEVASVDALCNPEPAQLMRTTSLANGSAECPFGGRRVETGRDDGANGGVAGDGVLQDGEVRSSLLDCNGEVADPNQAIDPPAGPAGTATIDLSGGTALTGLQGGDGGQLTFDTVNHVACIPELTRVFPTGSVDASFAAPDLTIALGDEPLTVSSDLSILPLQGEALAGSYYLDAQAARIVHATEQGLVTVSGVRIEPAATLTLPSASQVTLDADLAILGTLRTAESDSASLSLQVRSFLIGATGKLDIPQGLPVDEITLRATDSIVLQGTLSAAGARPGASGARVLLTSGGTMILSGSVDVSGAESPSTGGAGGSLLATAATSLWNAAHIDASGGAGSVTGGTGGSILLGSYTDFPPADVEVRNTGRLDASGGQQASCPESATCVGGTGGLIQIHAAGAPLRSTGELHADGGASTQQAGDGGIISLRVLAGPEGSAAPVVMSIAGSISARGGEAQGAEGRAGNGGGVRVGHCIEARSVAEFLGYAQLSFAGGPASDSSGSGGDGGKLELLATGSFSEPRRLSLHVPLYAVGGAGFQSGQGGALDVDLSEGGGMQATAGGPVLLHAWPSWIPSLVIAGEHRLDAGPSGAGGSAPAGHARLRARGSLRLQGDVQARGGVSDGDGNSMGGSVDLSASNELILMGKVSVDGADSALHAGASGGCVSASSRTLELSGSISARGGAAKSGLAAGGAGGSVRRTTREDETITGEILLDGGAGSPEGKAGTSLTDDATPCL
jgi:hypothetical protein